ncbi:Methylmalonyl-CoA carboxyltransferase [Azospirillaceae bacterium]
MTDPRKQLLETMAAIRETLNPKVVERLDLATQGKVPYDKDAAREAVKLFLAEKKDGGRFKAQLAERMKRPEKLH